MIHSAQRVEVGRTFFAFVLLFPTPTSAGALLLVAVVLALLETLGLQPGRFRGHGGFRLLGLLMLQLELVVLPVGQDVRKLEQDEPDQATAQYEYRVIQIPHGYHLFLCKIAIHLVNAS